MRLVARPAPRRLSGIPEGVASRTATFRRQANDFVRELQRQLPDGATDADETARRNVAVTRAVFGKWATQILVTLYSLRNVGFQEIRRRVKGVSPRVLSSKLKLLEGWGLVSRTVVNERPPRVFYQLTDTGLLVADLGAPVVLYLRLLAGRRR